MDRVFQDINILQGFGGREVTSPQMRRAIGEWFRLFYCREGDENYDPSLQIPYTVVRKLTRGVFSEYETATEGKATKTILEGLDRCAVNAVELALVGGESFLKPVTDGRNWYFRVLDRRDVLIFARDAMGNIVDIGTAERSVAGRGYYTLLERRRLEDGRLTIENRLFRSAVEGQLGRPVPLGSHPLYAGLPESFTFPERMDCVGFVSVKNPATNCVDGSFDGVSVYAPAVGLIRALARNEALLSGEFERGQSRIVVSRDMLEDGQLRDNVFVGLDEAADRVGITVFAPELREQSYLSRKQAYLRDVENIIGLKRGILSQVEETHRTATEITTSQGEYALTILDFQRMWEGAAREAVRLCRRLGKVYGMATDEEKVDFKWGNGVLHD